MQFRKLAAVAGTALMAGLSMAGPALAATVTNVADIGNLASGSSGSAMMPTFVVGNDAAPADVASAINLAAYLAGNVYKSESVTIAGGAATADGAVMRVELDNTTAYTRDFDLAGVGNELSLQPVTRGGRPATFLKEGSFTLSGTEYKYYEKIDLLNSNVSTSAGYYLKTGSAATEFENAIKDTGFTIPAEKIVYKLVFETAAPYGSNNLTGQTIKFLGKDYTVTYSSGTKVELSPVGGAVGLKAGGDATVSGYTLKCDSIATASGGSADAFLTVCKGTSCSASTSFRSGDTKTISAGGDSVQVTLQSVAYGASVSVLLGSATLKVENGQTLTGYPNWKSTITSTAPSISQLALTYAQPHSSFSATYPVLMTGQAITAPESFFVLKNMGPEAREYYRMTATSGTGDFNGDGTASDHGVTLKLTDAATGAALKMWDVGGGTYADQVTLDTTNAYTWRYLNSSSGWSNIGMANTTSFPRLSLTERTLTFEVRNTTYMTSEEAADQGGQSTDDGVLQIVEPALTEATTQNAWFIEMDYSNADSVQAFANVSVQTVGPSGDTNPTYLWYGFANTAAPGNGVVVAYGGTTPKSRSGGFTSYYGTKFVSADASQIVLDVPKSEVYYDLLLGKEAGASSASGTVTSKVPIQITSDIAKLDTEISDASTLTADTVIMGGPAVNKLAAQLLGKTYPTKGADSGIPENAALIQVFQNAFGSGKVAVLVAGWEAAETDLAVAAIQAGKVTTASAKVKVSGSVAAPSVETIA